MTDLVEIGLFYKRAMGFLEENTFVILSLFFDFSHLYYLQ